MTTKLWTYAVIDWDLLNDDRESATGILPGHFWTTAEEARDVLVEELRERWADEDSEDEDFEAPVFRVLDNGDLYCEDWSGCELQVYALTPGKSIEQARQESQKA